MENGALNGATPPACLKGKGKNGHSPWSAPRERKRRVKTQQAVLSSVEEQLEIYTSPPKRDKLHGKRLRRAGWRPFEPPAAARTLMRSRRCRRAGFWLPPARLCWPLPMPAAHPCFMKQEERQALQRPVAWRWQRPRSRRHCWQARTHPPRR